MTSETVYQNVHGSEEFRVVFTSDADDPNGLSAEIVGDPLHRNRSDSIPALAAAVAKTKHWIGDVMDDVQWSDAQKAYHGIRAVLHTLRDHLTVQESADLAAQLPMMLRGLYYDGWQPAAAPKRDRTRRDFLKHISKAFPDDSSVDPERLTIAVLKVLRRHVSEGEMKDIRAILPASLSKWVA
ncbi:DUF2267 domain-containing protein [Roseiconus nitratireducens]|uniref:DUF2267 domain-containing protein n=1 Tax=Roseiconus nitratireducens TaxID=2605748 RepID=A0A5M6D6G1_9BACT|nr:DUF2267 domain-containing protein [Roseiconus nitratireducens]KAA5543127.1 DUF2267 domain-containing protein [Roseiconus nitratireducens]